MKKIYVVCLIATIALASSCNIPEEYSLNRRDLVKFRAMLSDVPMSKTVLQSDGSLYWTPGNAINLFFGSSGSSRFESDITSPSAQSNFIGSLDGFLPNGSDYFWAVYPFNSDNSYDGSSVTLTLPEEQTAVAGTFADDLFISVARSVDYTLQFYNVCGGVKFSVANEGIKYVTLKGNGGEVLAGQVKVAFSSDGKPYVQQVVDGETEIRVNAPGGGSFVPGEWYYIVALPTTFSSGYTMDFYKDELFAERKTESSIAINRSVWGKLTEADDVVAPITVNKYLTFTSEGTTTISLRNYGGNAPILFYSTDLFDWTQWDYSELSFTNSQPLYLCGDNPSGFSHSYNMCSIFSATGDYFAIAGDIMSLIDNQNDISAIPTEYCYYGLFKTCTSLTAAPELPATSLTAYCYDGMFNWCTSLTAAPELPATSLAAYCYSYMFCGCTSLTAAPELPATTLAEHCYNNMFTDCYDLVTVPELPATTLAVGCYKEMFYVCPSLTAAPELPATSLAEYCYADMFYGCTNLTAAPELPATALADGCYKGMFSGCTSLTAAPDLPATTLADGCYRFMFYDCDNLTTAPDLPATTLAIECYSSMFYGCTSLTAIPVLPATLLAAYCYNFMFSGCTSLTTAPDLPATTLAESCYEGLFSGCTSLTAAPELPATTLAIGCYSSMFDGCTSLTTAPELPATTLADYCYGDMFTDCTNLSYVKSLATDISAANSTLSWLSGVASTGTFVKSFSMSDWPTGADGIPEGWIVQNDDGSPIDPIITASKYLTFTSEGTTTISIENYYGNAPLLYYSTDATNWIEWDYSGLTFTSSNPLYICGDNPEGFCASGRWSIFSATGSHFGISGDVMSLIDKEEDVYQIPNPYCFSELFQGCAALTTGPDLTATTLTEGCYSRMFVDCASLTVAPALPAESLATSCYRSMFLDCDNMKTAPDLPATTLADYCYYGMFFGCRALLSAPELPATTLTDGCYGEMFYGCTSLTTAPDLPASTLKNSCYQSMFEGCTSLRYVKCLATNITAGNCIYKWLTNVGDDGSFIKAPDMTGWTYSSDFGVPYGWTILSDSETPINVSKYLTFTSEGVTKISLQNNGGNTPILYYSTDKVHWGQWDYSNQLSFTTLKTLYICGDNPNGFSTSGTKYSTFTITGDKFNISGDIMSLIDKDVDEYSIPNANCFYMLFVNCSQLVSAPELPATSLTYGCYRSMFSGCTSLKNAPELPATTIPMAAYVEMFKGCSSLISAPELPATILDQSCYGNMFEDCTNLVTAPNLPATELTDFCYSLMFKGCTKLSAAPELPATELAKYCYAAMFTDCTSLVLPPTLPATTLDESCYAEMFVGCTSLSTAPELPATTMQDECYYRMFEGCINLTSAPVLPATVLEKQCYWEMFKGCSSLNYVKCLATYIRDTQAVNAWLNGVSSTGTFVKAASMSGWSTGNSGIPKNWTVVDAE